MYLKIAIFSIAKYTGMFALARRLTAKHIRILCYHGGSLGDEKQYNPKLFAPKDFFQRRIDWLAKKGFNIVSLNQAVSENEKYRKKLTTVITFDDGWYSTGSELLPVLEKSNLPSTLYLCTQHFLEAWPVLNVSVRYLLWKASPNVQVQELSANLDGRYDLTDSTTHALLAQGLVRYISENANCRQSICHLLEEVARKLGVDPSCLQLDSRRFDYMSAEEIKRAAANGCSIELHGHVHRYPLGQPDVFRDDLQRCNEVIRSLGLPKPAHYCYPSGEFDNAAATIMAEQGVLSATTCLPGLIKKASMPRTYYLPRFLDGESIHDVEFEAELSGFSELLRRILRRSSSNGYGT